MAQLGQEVREIVGRPRGTRPLFPDGRTLPFDAHTG
jgi:hypothetical protein